MSEYRLASRYAKSLIELASEKNQLDAVHADMRLIQQVCKASRELVLMLKNPVIHLDRKSKILNAIFGNKVSTITQSFINLVTAKGREAFLPVIASSFVEQYNKLKKIVSAKFTTAVAVDQSITDRIRKMVQQATGRENIDIATRVDPKLIGGYILEFEDKQLDTSVHRNLETLDDNFLVNIYSRKFNA